MELRGGGGGSMKYPQSLLHIFGFDRYCTCQPASYVVIGRELSVSPARDYRTYLNPVSEMNAKENIDAYTVIMISQLATKCLMGIRMIRVSAQPSLCGVL